MTCGEALLQVWKIRELGALEAPKQKPGNGNVAESVRGGRNRTGRTVWLNHLESTPTPCFVQVLNTGNLRRASKCKCLIPHHLQSAYCASMGNAGVSSKCSRFAKCFLRQGVGYRSAGERVVKELDSWRFREAAHGRLLEKAMGIGRLGGQSPLSSG